MTTMRPCAAAALKLDSASNQEENHSFCAGEKGEELYVGEDGLISVLNVDDKCHLDKLKGLLEHRENELRQAAEYGLGLLEANEELQMQVATLKIQLETETEELSVEGNTWQRRTEHAKQETAQWKRKFTSLAEEKANLAEKFQHFVDHCQCRIQDPDNVTKTSGNMVFDYQNTITQLETELHKAQAAERLNETELLSLRQWKAMAEQQQHEELECKDLAVQAEASHWKKVEQELIASQRAMIEVKHENDALRNDAQKHVEELHALKKQLCAAEETIGDIQVQSNELSEKLLSSESRCKRLQRELELLDHVSYFSQAILDRDDKESDEEDEVSQVKDVRADKDEGNNREDESVASDARTPSPLKIKRRSLLVAGVPLSNLYDDALNVQTSEPEKETQKKLHHYFHLTALSIIHENNLHERCFNSSSRLTIDMWYREIIAKEIPFLRWHSWLINRISEVAASVQDEDNTVKKRTLSSSFSGTFHGFSLRRSTRGGNVKSAKNALPSPPTASSSPASSPIARVPFNVAKAFFRLLRKRTQGGVNATPVDGPTTEVSSPVG